MNAEDDNLPTIADSSAKDASEIGKENFINIDFKQQESDSGYSSTKLKISESGYNSQRTTGKLLNGRATYSTKKNFCRMDDRAVTES